MGGFVGACVGAVVRPFVGATYGAPVGSKVRVLVGAVLGAVKTVEGDGAVAVLLESFLADAEGDCCLNDVTLLVLLVAKLWLTPPFLDTRKATDMIAERNIRNEPARRYQTALLPLVTATGAFCCAFSPDSRLIALLVAAVP